MYEAMYNIQARSQQARDSGILIHQSLDQVDEDSPLCYLFKLTAGGTTLSIYISDTIGTIRANALFSIHPRLFRVAPSGDDQWSQRPCSRGQGRGGERL